MSSDISEKPIGTSFPSYSQPIVTSAGDLPADNMDSCMQNSQDTEAVERARFLQDQLAKVYFILFYLYQMEINLTREAVVHVNSDDRVISIIT